jgi:hypothetical protein
MKKLQRRTGPARRAAVYARGDGCQLATYFIIIHAGIASGRDLFAAHACHICR